MFQKLIGLIYGFGLTVGVMAVVDADIGRVG
jgi:hypothetical protein